MSVFLWLINFSHVPRSNAQPTADQTLAGTTETMHVQGAHTAT